jgi:hypothetical protein
VRSWGTSGTTRQVVQIEVTNYGGRPTTLKNITVRYFKHRRWEWLRNRAAREAVFLDDRLGLPGLPFELNPGGVWSGSTRQSKFMDWGPKGVWYFELHHSDRRRPLRKRVYIRPAPPGP